MTTGEKEFIKIGAEEDITADRTHLNKVVFQLCFSQLCCVCGMVIIQMKKIHTGLPFSENIYSES